MKKFNEFDKDKRLSLIKSDEYYMQIAIKEAEKAKLDGNLAVGSVLVFSNGKYVSDSNTTYSEGDDTNHAEMNVMRKARQIFNRGLDGAVLYTTVEPCIMCVGAAHNCGIKEVVFGVYDSKNGFVSSKILADHNVFGIAYKGGVLVEECFKLLPKDEFLSE